MTSVGFGADWGSPLAAAAVGVAMVISVVCLTALVIGLSRTRRQAEGFSLGDRVRVGPDGRQLRLPLAGAALLRRVALFTPNGWAMRGYTDLSTNGGGLRTVALPVARDPRLQRGGRRRRRVARLAGGDLVSGRAVRVLAVTRVSVRRYARDRRALLFVLILPTMVILILGRDAPGLHDASGSASWTSAPGRRVSDLNGALEHSPALSVKHYGTLASARRGVARGEVSTAVILPAGMDAALQHGSSVTIEVLADPLNGTEQAAAAAVASVVSEQGSRVQAAVFATAEASGTLQQNLTRATTVQGTLADVGVVASQVQTRQSVLPEGFRYSAPTMLVLFVFLNALAGGAIIVENRRSGMYERMAAAPIRPWTIVEGEALTYVGIAVVQSLLIVGLGAVVFGVSWGDPVAAAALIAVWERRRCRCRPAVGHVVQDTGAGHVDRPRPRHRARECWAAACGHSAS